MTRGLRNRNPGNLRDFGIPWRGRTGKDADGFTIFDTMRNGVRAMALDILNDWGKGRKTIGSILAEYAPSHENPTEGYAAYVAKRCGVSVADPIDPYNQTMLLNMVDAMTRFECGEAINVVDLEDGVEDALHYRAIRHAGRINDKDRKIG